MTKSKTRPKAKSTEDWVEEEVAEEKGLPSDEVRIDPKIIIAVAVIFFAIAAFFVLQSKQSVTFNKSSLYGIDIYSKGSDPLSDLKSLGSKTNFVASYLNKNPTNVERNVLIHIGTVSSSKLYESGLGYKIKVGITNRTGIWVEKDFVNIEGKNARELWNAAYVFSAAINGIAFSPDPFVQFSVNKRVVNLLVNESVCAWSDIIVNLGNINGAMGYIQSDLKFTFRQYAYDKTTGQCLYQFSIPVENTTINQCPQEDPSTLLIVLERGEENIISWNLNEIRLQYTDCDSMRKESALMRDILAPDFLSAVENVDIVNTLPR